MTKQAKGICDICQVPLMAKDEANLKRVIGYHKSRYHGVKGQFSTPESRRIASRERYWRIKGYSPEKIAALRSKYASKESAAPMGEPVRKQRKQDEPADPMALTYCPYCSRRFYSIKKGQE